MSNIVYPKYAVGDIVKINPQGVGQSYSTYKEFFTLYGINSSNYKPDNDLCDYLESTFTILCIAPHRTEQIPLYVITDECSSVTFLVNEKAILEVTGKKDLYINPYYGMINNITEQYYNLKNELFDAYSQIEYLKSKANIEPMPKLMAGMFGKIKDSRGYNSYFVVIKDQAGKPILTTQDGDFFYVNVDSEIGFDVNGYHREFGEITKQIITIYSTDILCFNQAERATEDSIRWER